MVRALAVVWLFTDLRSDEILRLRVGSIRWKNGAVIGGRSDQEILEHYKALYGDRILIVPDGRTGQLLFALPVVVFIVCSGTLLFFLRDVKNA